MIDGVIRKASAGNGDSTGAVTLALGGHSVTESAVGGTSLSNYTTTFGGDCQSTGQVLVNAAKTCEVTNTRKLGTGGDAYLTVRKVVIPANDPGRFDLLVNGATKASNVRDGGTTGPVTVLAGTHTVGESGVNTNLVSYSRTYYGDCDASGRVTLMAGDNKTCTIRNSKKAIAVAPVCLDAGKICCETDDTGTSCTLCVRPPAVCPSTR
jgi:hypothetical protein